MVNSTQMYANQADHRLVLGDAESKLQVGTFVSVGGVSHSKFLYKKMTDNLSKHRCETKME